jgi:hypothetical protein
LQNLQWTIAERTTVMADDRRPRGWWIAVGLALLGSVAAFVNESIGYQRTGTVDWGHVALAVGVPILIYAIARRVSAHRA